MYCGKCSVSRRGVHAIPTRSKRLAMNIVMFTNTYRPHVGGVANSVAWLAENLRGAGHRVLVVAPEFPGCATNEPGVVRIPAMQNFRGSDFSVPIPLPRPLRPKKGKTV